MRKISTFVIAGTACGLASAQSDLDIERAYAAELAADAADRTSLLQGAAEGSGFTLTSGNGENTLTTNAFIQFRYVANFRDGDDATMNPIDDDEFTHGFEIPRARIDWSGNLMNDNLTYRVSGDFGEDRQFSGGGSGQNNFGVTWAYLQYNLEQMDGAFVRAGQFKAPLLWEELVDPEFQLAADRSVANEAFNQYFSQGLMLGYEAEAWRGYFALTDGLRSIGTTYNGARESDIALTARAEFKFAGDWDRFTDFTSWRNSDYAGKVGAAIHWETFGETNPSNMGTVYPIGAGSDGDFLVYTVDANIEGNGWNAFGAFVGSYIDSETGATDFEFDDFAAVVQAGVFLTEQVELFGRWDALFLDEDRFTGDADDTFNFATAGVNYYFFPESHAVKGTLDVIVGFDDTSNLNAGGAGSILPGNSGNYSPTSLLGTGDDSEVAVRGQVSVLF